MIEDSPPNIPSTPAPNEITSLSERKTVPPMEVVDSKMVALSLSSMATTLEQIQLSVAAVPELARAVRALELQHESMLDAIGGARGASNLAGGIASEALASCERIETAVGQLALSVQGLEEASRSLIETVFPERDTTPPLMDVEWADVVPIHRRQVMTGE